LSNVGTFREWLLRQVDRDDFVGQLARIAKPFKWQDANELREELYNSSSGRKTACSALEDAIYDHMLDLEYEKYGFVYFVRAGDNGPIKIGFSRNVNARIASLQTAHPERLKLLAVRRGHRDSERDFHARFAHLRLEGEWFLPEPELLSATQEMGTRA
jgi:hypothetical protein